MSLATCTASTTLYDADGNPERGVKFYVSVISSEVLGSYIQPADFNLESDANGRVAIRVVKGATVRLFGNHPSFADVRSGTWPDTDTADLLEFGV